MSNLDKYNKVFSTIFKMDADSFDHEFTFKAVEKWDSITHMSLIAELEDEFDIMIDTDDLLNYGSYENGKKILQKYGVDI